MNCYENEIMSKEEEEDFKNFLMGIAGAYIEVEEIISKDISGSGDK